MIAKLHTLLLCNSGGSAAEYALILGLVSTAIIAGLTLLGGAIAAPFTAASTALTP